MYVENRRPQNGLCCPRATLRSMGFTKCQKPRLWWDSNPQPLNGLFRQPRSPMRYPLRHRARRSTRLGLVKAFLPYLCPSIAGRVDRCVGRKTGPRVSVQLMPGSKAYSVLGVDCPGAGGGGARETAHCPHAPHLPSCFGKARAQLY
ncbi:hypothetical protein ROHU_016570 [Labeo rohita]|uniref:Uncharacterized protein n=1 Tax=Labeo rohita TaxID=84645 RepID=A0A498NJC9_LABRO|nr:hypothetical protein ROHU_016570 [Labeo rohita]